MTVVRGANLVTWHRSGVQIKQDLDALKARGYDTVAVHHSRYTATRDDYPVPTQPPAEWKMRRWVYPDVGQDAERPWHNTQHPALVEYALAYGKSIGLVMIDKPAVNPRRGGWQGYFTMRDIYQSPARWDVSTKYLGEYWLGLVKPEMEICRSVECALCLGVEMRGWTLEVGDSWLRQLVVLVRKAGFRGPLLYAANHGDEAQKLLYTGFWKWFLEENAQNRVGIDLYTPIAVRATNDHSELVAGARQVYEMHRGIFELGVERVLLTEFSYPSIPDAAVKPWGVSEAERPQIPDYQTQAACFSAWAEVFGNMGAIVWQALSEGGGDQHDISLNPEAERIFLGR